MNCKIISSKKIFKQICLAVALLHDNGIAHMDIKPENIFYGTLDNIRLGDFGGFLFANAIDLISLDTRRGTLHYMPPEMVRQDLINPQKADIWSLGIVLHVLLFSCWPFQFKSEQNLPFLIANGNVSFNFSDSHPPELRLLLKRMLHKKPFARPSIHEVLNSEWLQQTDCSECVNLVNSRTHIRPRLAGVALLQAPPKQVDKKIKSKTPKVVRKIFSTMKKKLDGNV